MARSGPLRYATSMPFPGPIPDSPWKLLPPQDGVPYFPYTKKGTPSTYGDTPDGGSRDAYDVLPAVYMGLPAMGLVWLAGKYGKQEVTGRDYAAAFTFAASSRVLFDAFGTRMLALGPVEGVTSLFKTNPKGAIAAIAIGVLAPVAVLTLPMTHENRARRNRRNRR